MGDITLSVWRTDIILIEEVPRAAPPPEQLVHERTKKATRHKVKYVCFISPNSLKVNSMIRRLGTETQRKPTTSARTKDIDKQPLVTFVFKYRPIGEQRKVFF